VFAYFARVSSAVAGDAAVTGDSFVVDKVKKGRRKVIATSVGLLAEEEAAEKEIWRS
jgi:hypothetical protein